MPGRVRLVVCVNQRLGRGQRSCVGSGNLDYIDRVEDEINRRGLDVPVVRRECLGRCEQGPVMRLAPGGRFFTEINAGSLESILLELERFLGSQADAKS